MTPIGNSESGKPRGWRSPAARISLVVAALVLLLPLGGWAFLILCIFSPLPIPTTIAADTLLIFGIDLLVIRLFAPMPYRTHFTLAVAVLIIALHSVLVRSLEFDSLPTMINPAIGVAAVVWLFMSRRRLSGTRNRRLLPAAIILLLPVLLIASYVHVPAFPASLPDVLQKDAGVSRASVAAFYSYTLDHVFDSDYLWRIDAPTQVLVAIAHKLRMVPMTAAPAEFW